MLVVLAVIFLPLLFDGSGMSRPRQAISLDLPEMRQENTVTITLKPQSPRANAAPVQAQDRVQALATTAAKPPPARLSASKPAAKPAPQAALKPALKPAPKPKPPAAAKAAPAAPAATQWVVQLGSFSRRANARALRDQLIHKGYKSFVEVSGLGDKQVFRVRVGPERTRARAEAIRSKLQQQGQHKGLVMAYP